MMKLKHLFLFEELPVYSEPFYGNDMFKIRFRQLTDLSTKRAPDNDNRGRLNNEPLDDFQVGDKVFGTGVKDGKEHSGEIIYIKKDKAGDGLSVKIEEDGKLVRLKPGTVKLQASGKVGNRKVAAEAPDTGTIDYAQDDTFQPFSYESHQEKDGLNGDKTDKG